MIEKVVLDYLRSKGITAFMEEPQEPPSGTFVILQKTGSSVENRIHQALFTAQSIAPSLTEAAELNEAVKAAMEELRELDVIAASRLNSDYCYIDTTRKRPRYQAVFQVTHY